MNGIVINIDPVILQIGHFEVRWYAVTMLLAVVAAVLIMAHRGKKSGIATEEIYSLALWVVPGGIIGARLVHVIDYWGYYSANPMAIFAFWQGGLAIWGAILGGVTGRYSGFLGASPLPISFISPLRGMKCIPFTGCLASWVESLAMA